MKYQLYAANRKRTLGYSTQSIVPQYPVVAIYEDNAGVGFMISNDCMQQI